METPLKAVPMPPSKREELKRLAAAATPGPWCAVPWMGVPAAEDGTWPTPDKSQWRTRIGVEQSAGDEKDRSSVFYGDSTPWGSGASLNDAEYIASASPDVALGLLAQMEALEADNKVQAARLATLEAEAAAARQKLEDERARHKVEVLDILRDMRLPMLDVRGTPAGRHQILGRNAERQAINFYCRQKAYEYDPQGIGPDPTEVGQWDTRPAPAAAPLVGEAGPADSQLPWNPGFTPKCHGCGLPSHAKRCTTVNCPAKPTAGAPLEREAAAGQGKEARDE